MPRLIRLDGAVAMEVADDFVTLADDQDLVAGNVIVSLARFQLEGEALLGEGRKVGIRLAPNEAVETLAYDLPRLAVVALTFPKYRDGRAFSAALILRQRLGFGGEVRAVGEVLLEQARFMIRSGFDAFEPADATTPAQWSDAGHRFRHVYQRAADDLTPAFVERAGG